MHVMLLEPGERIVTDPDDLGAVALDGFDAQSAPVPMEEMRC
jgi:hypothetical protein